MSDPALPQRRLRQRVPKRQDWLPNRMFDPANNPFAIQHLLARERDKENALFHREVDGRPEAAYSDNTLLRDQHSLPPKAFSPNPLLDDAIVEETHFLAEYDDDEAGERSTGTDADANIDADTDIDSAKVHANGSADDAIDDVSAAVTPHAAQATDEGLAADIEVPITAAMDDHSGKVAARADASATLSTDAEAPAESPTDTATATDTAASGARADDAADDRQEAEIRNDSNEQNESNESSVALTAVGSDGAGSSALPAQDGGLSSMAGQGASSSESLAEATPAPAQDSLADSPADSPADASSDAQREAHQEAPPGGADASDDSSPPSSATEPALNSEAIDSLLEAAREQAREQGRQEARETAYQEGLNAGVAQAKAEMQEAVDEQRAQLAQIIRGLQQLSDDPDTLFEPMKKLAVHLAEQLVRGELTQSPQTIARLVDNCLRELAASGEKAVVVHLNPEDVEQYKPLIASFGDSIVLRPDALLSRGSVRASLDGSMVEDLIDRRVKGISTALAQPMAAGWRPVAPNPLRSATPTRPATTTIASAADDDEADASTPTEALADDELNEGAHAESHEDLHHELDGELHGEPPHDLHEDSQETSHEAGTAAQAVMPATDDTGDTGDPGDTGSPASANNAAPGKAPPLDDSHRAAP